MLEVAFLGTQPKVYKLVIKTLYQDAGNQPATFSLTMSDSDGDIANVRLDSPRNKITQTMTQVDQTGPPFTYPSDRDDNMFYKVLLAYASDQAAYQRLRAWGDAVFDAIPSARCGQVRIYGMHGLGPTQFEVTI